MYSKIQSSSPVFVLSGFFNSLHDFDNNLYVSKINES